MYKNYFVAALLLGCFATRANAQSDENPKQINWLALTHHSNLTKKELLADKRIAIQEKISDSDLVKGTVYLHCVESGALLDAVPIKDAYWVMVFPDIKATKFNFRVVDTDFLLDEGIDVKLLRQVLRMSTGHEMNTEKGIKNEPGMGGPSTPFTLDVRFTAKWNRNWQKMNTIKP